ncbi:MAG: NERD domain-containing protein [Hydrogenophaga sp.]|jgi:hypothetical protein|nr:NERD domain-containing protein [Hydrogenophaga sp.]
MMSRKKQRSPLDRARPLRVAGQSLDEEIDDFAYDHLLAPMMLALMLIVVAALEWWRFLYEMKPNPLAYSVVALVGVAYAFYKVWRNRIKLKQLKQGRDGERAVAQYLEWFRSAGFFVFHDVPNGDANIDHLIVGPKGVFTIETKTLSKPERGPCKLSLVDGKILANGNPLERDPLIQAKAQAGWMMGFLKEARFDAHVWPVVLFPGWFVEPFDVRATGAWVLEPKAMGKFMENEPDRLSRDEVKAIGSAVTSYIRAELGKTA